MRRHLQIALLYLIAYVALDWLSFVHPIAGLPITPWNPQPGLSFALILLFGRRFIPWLFVAPLLADMIVRGSTLPLWWEIAAAAIIGTVYGAATSLLTSRALRFDLSLSHKRDILCLLSVAAAASAIVAVSYVLLVVNVGLVPPEQFLQAAIRYWIGDAIGIAVVTPFLIVLFARRVPGPAAELLGPLVLLAGSLWLIAGLEEFRFQLFYLLFLPVIWMAVRFGLEGVAFGLAVAQLSLIAVLQFSGRSAIDVTAFQAMMMVLALTGLAVGVIVREQSRTQRQLQLHRDALTRATHLASMGEFAAALAHELNQPLTAIANYTRLAHEAAAAPSPDHALIAEAAAKATEQVDRAAAVMRRLRDCIQLGRTEAGIVSLQNVVKQAQQLVGADLEQHGIALVRDLPDLPFVRGDTLQIEQVVLNLLRNSIEAIVEAGRHDGRINISGEAVPEGYVTLVVRDNGPGLGDVLTNGAVTPFTTTKPEGLGLGLALSRSILESHGGRLALAGDVTGAVVSFTLPVAGMQGAAS